MSAHAYWRIYVTEKNHATVVEAEEIEFRATVNGADQCSGGTAFGSSDQQAPANAFDNSVSTRWYSSVANPIIGYQFASPVVVNEIAIYEGGFPGQAPKSFYLQYSDDGITYYNQEFFQNKTSWFANSWHIFNAVAIVLTGNITESLAITDWTVSAVKCATGYPAGQTNTTSSSYSITVNTTDPINLVLAPKIDGKWEANTVQAVGKFIVPVNPDTTPHLFKVTAVTGDAKFGATEPTYNLSGNTVSGNVTLTYVAPLVDPVTLGPKIPV